MFQEITSTERSALCAKRNLFIITPLATSQILNANQARSTQTKDNRVAKSSYSEKLQNKFTAKKPVSM